MILVSCSSVCCSSTTASKTRLSRNVLGMVIAFWPEHWSDSRFYQVTPRQKPKYLKRLTVPFHEAQADDGASDLEQRHVSTDLTLETNAQFAKFYKPSMCALNGLVTNGKFFLTRFASLRLASSRYDVWRLRSSHPSEDPPAKLGFCVRIKMKHQ